MYSQIPETFDRNRILKFFRDKFTTFDAIRIALEQHKDGGHHIYIYVDIELRPELDGGVYVINNFRFLDYCDTHPNITAIKVTSHKV